MIFDIHRSPPRFPESPGQFGSFFNLEYIQQVNWRIHSIGYILQQSEKRKPLSTRRSILLPEIAKPLA